MEHFSRRTVSGVECVTPTRKRLDAAYSVWFREEMKAMISGGVTRIVLDLSQVEFIDSSGLGALVSLMKSLGGAQNLVLCGVREAPMSVFRMTRMDKVFTLKANELEALEGLGVIKDT